MCAHAGTQREITCECRRNCIIDSVLQESDDGNNRRIVYFANMQLNEFIRQQQYFLCRVILIQITRVLLRDGYI